MLYIFWWALFKLRRTYYGINYSIFTWTTSCVCLHLYMLLSDEHYSDFAEHISSKNYNFCISLCCIRCFFLSLSLPAIFYPSFSCTYVWFHIVKIGTHFLLSFLPHTLKHSFTPSLRWSLDSPSLFLLFFFHTSVYTLPWKDSVIYSSVFVQCFFVESCQS